MYTTYFGFDDKPFKLNDPRNFYSNANFDSVCADLLEGIYAHHGFMLLTGEAGVGKTVMLRRCSAAASEDIRFILLANASLDFPDIINYLCAHLEIASARLELHQQIYQLLEVLTAHAKQGRTVVLVIDDAHSLRVSALVQLRAFVEMPPSPRQRLQVVLVGLPELEGKLRQPELRPLWDLLIRCRLNRLEEREIESFIHHQLQVTGRQDGILWAPAAIQRVAQYCKGVPRAIAMLCDAALLFASLEQNREITPELIDEAAQSCFLDLERSQRTPIAPPPVSPKSTVDLDIGLPPDFVLNDNSIPLLSAESAMRQAEPVLDHPADRPQPEAVMVSASKRPEPGNASGSMGFALGEHAPNTQPRLEPASLRSRISILKPALQPMSTAGGSDEAEHRGVVTVEQTRFQPDVQPVTSRQIAIGVDPASRPMPQLSVHLRELEQLLYEILAKKGLKTERDQKALLHFQILYFQVLFGLDERLLAEYEQRMARLTEKRQPVLIGLATDVGHVPGRMGTFCALVMNPTWWLFREVRLRLVCPDLVLADGGHFQLLKLLDGRDAQPVYLEYEIPASTLRTTVKLELDLCDHRGDWQAYSSRSEILLDFPGKNGERRVQNGMMNQPQAMEHFLPSGPVEAEGAPAPDWLWTPDTRARAMTSPSGMLMHTLPLELEANAERTHCLQSRVATSGRQSLSRGTPMTRALLRSTDSAHAPLRIELVSRPLMILGRYNEMGNKGFGDFALGFVAEYGRISRLHCVICALGEQLAVMPTGNQGYTYTAWNGQRLERGCWQTLAAGDALDVCGLYQLRLTLGWDKKGSRVEPTWDVDEPRNKFGRYLLDLVDLLRQLDQNIGVGEQRAKLRTRYLNLLHMQDRAAELNGVGNSGNLLYARFDRSDAGRSQVVHYYVPKWLPLGSSADSGLRINAEGVAPHHAELLFREGMYWIQNLAGHGAVRVCSHGLATNEVLALEEGDTLTIGSARFVFGCY